MRLTKFIKYIVFFSFSIAAAFLFIACEVADSEREENDVVEKTVVPYTEGVRIAWDYRTLTQVFEEQVSYPRIIRLSSCELLTAFEHQGEVYVSQSSDDGKSWTEAERVAPRDGDIISAVPELIQLENGDILLAYNTRAPQYNEDPEKRFGIKLRISNDGGGTWSSQQNVFEGGYEWNRGVWEPAMIQLSSGEIQLFFANEYPYKNSEDQEISMVRSADKGQSWTDPETISYREGHRDGMPVPLILDNGEGIAVAIEDNGLHGSEFKPSIIWTSMEDNWEQGAAGGTSDRRWGALTDESQLPASDYGGAPYLQQFSSGETILSFQSTEGRNVEWHHSTMTVAIGNEQAKNFSRKSEPFEVAEDRYALWSSLFIKNDTTVTALSATTAYNAAHSQLYTIDGYLIEEMEAFNGQVEVDGRSDEEAWNRSTDNFIGAYSPVNAEISSAWDENNLYVWASVNDSDSYDSSDSTKNSPGVAVMVAPEKLSDNSLVEGTYKVFATPSEDLLTHQGSSGLWTENIMEIELVANEHPTGYQLEIAIPWAEIGGRPENDQGIGFNIELQSRSESDGTLQKETLSGNRVKHPSTWTKIELKQ
ncbi:hypothetical protein CK503_00560 [Aliifodinibius salipaludis]|uniref:Sialidase domain-containing protein n=1 Tax=Fodinibius salipaludis TaxID=2032627 RepID=A0A2A2GDG8_9BACT|nr:exo-alpha-sialidase [Aliifodinibius salipaludis]PAU95591.1 hypothetical protein CK503_00560 [Aliifodinibius salipaludis]